MSWLKALDIGLDLADAILTERNASRLKELQIQGTATALIEAITQELRNSIFNYKQSAESILANENESPVISAGAMKLLEQKLLDSGISPEIFKEISDKEYAVNAIRFIKENSNRMLASLSEKDKHEVIRVATVASRLEDYNFYVENYQKGKDLQKAYEAINTYKDRQGCLPIIGIILYIYPGIAFPALLSIGLGGNNTSGQVIVGLIGFGLWIWGLVNIFKWRNGGGFKEAKKVFEESKGSDFNLDYFNQLEKEFGNVEEIRKRRYEAQQIAGNFFKNSSLFQSSYIELEKTEDSKLENSSTSEIKEKNIISTNDSLPPLQTEEFKQPVPILQQEDFTKPFNIRKVTDSFSYFLSAISKKLKIVSVDLFSQKISKRIFLGILATVLVVIGYIIYINQLTPMPGLQIVGSVYDGTPIPSSRIPINPQNVDQLSILAEWEGNAVKFSSDGNLIVVASSTGIYIYNTINFEEVKFIKTDTPIKDVSFSPNGDLFAAASPTGLFLYNSTTFNQVNFIPTDFPIVSISYSPDGTYLSVLTDRRKDQGLSNYTIEIWNVEINKLIFRVENTGVIGGGFGEIINGAVFSPDGKILATSHGREPVQLWRVEDGVLVNTLSFPSKGSNGISHILFYQNGQFLVATSREGNVFTWSINDDSLISTTKVFENSLIGIRNLSFSPNNNFLAITTERPDDNFFRKGKWIGMVQIFPAGNWEPIKSLDTYGANTSLLAFSPDGQILATSGDWDTVIQLWHFSNGLLLKMLKGYGDLRAQDYAIDSLSFSPDGALLATKSWGGKIRIWGITGNANTDSSPGLSVEMPTATEIITSLATLQPTTNQLSTSTANSTSLEPSIENFSACSEQCNGNNFSTVFPEATKKIYAEWDYKNIPYGASYIRKWTMNDIEWVKYDCTWTGSENGRDSIQLSEPDGLHSGRWEVSIIVNGVVLLSQEITVLGNWDFWYPAGTFNSCYGTTQPSNTIVPVNTVQVTTTPIVCSNFVSQLQPNITAQVVTDAINVRENPGTNQTVAKIIYTGEKVQLYNEAPVCTGGYLWWKVKSINSGVTGWVVEGTTEERFLSP